MVSVITFNSYSLSLNPANVGNLSVKLCEKNEIERKKVGDGPFKTTRV